MYRYNVILSHEQFRERVSGTAMKIIFVHIRINGHYIVRSPSYDSSNVAHVRSGISFNWCLHRNRSIETNTTALSPPTFPLIARSHTRTKEKISVHSDDSSNREATTATFCDKHDVVFAYFSQFVETNLYASNRTGLRGRIRFYAQSTSWIWNRP